MSVAASTNIDSVKSNLLVRSLERMGEQLGLSEANSLIIHSKMAHSRVFHSKVVLKTRKNLKNYF